MKAQQVFCPVCDRRVSVSFTQAPTNPGGPPTLADSELVCLDIGEQCTTAVCPVTSVSPAAMDVRLVKSGMRPDGQRAIRATCDGCQRVADLVVSRDGYVTCIECGATRRMARA